MSDRRYLTDPNRRCERCGSAVSTRFVRVFGAGNTVYGCLDCLTRRELALGEAAVRSGGDADSGGGTVREHARWDPDGGPKREET